jgi:rod shape-determining protein MreC
LFQFFINRLILKIALILLLSTWVIYATSHQRAHEGKIEYFLNTAMVPLESSFNYLGKMTGDSLRTIAKLARLKAENDRLKSRISDLKARQIGFDALRLENKRLRNALQFMSGEPHELISAEIISVNPSNWNCSIVINKGRKDGIKKNMAVLSPEGVVGRIGEVRTRTAEVILITDPRQGNYIGGIVQRTRDMVFVIGGDHRGECTVQPAIENYFSDLRKGDLVVTSETSEIFPRGLPIGRVAYFIQRINNMVTKAYLKPVVKLGKLEIVYVIKTKRELPLETSPGGSENAFTNP